MLQLTSLENKANSPFWRLLSVEHRVGVDVEFTVISESTEREAGGGGGGA